MATKPTLPARKSLPQPADPLDQLKDDIVDEQLPISTVLRRAMLLAHRLEDKKFLDWAAKELNGYKRDDKEQPSYRTLYGDYVVMTAEGRPLPIHVEGGEGLANDHFVTLPLPELASYLGDNHDGPFVIPIGIGDKRIPGVALEPGDKWAFSFGRSPLVRLVQAVRQRILEWAMSIPKAAIADAFYDPDGAELLSKPATVFYSWQSDLPNSTNRGFIEDCLDRAIKGLKAEETIAVDPSLDCDTKDVPGSPNIAETILGKIDDCTLFVCDVSIINKKADPRLTPNPNVLVELGYAVKALSWDRIICVFNEATGRVEDLPFDLRHRRVRKYRLEKNEDKAEPRKLLVKLLTSDLKSAFSRLDPDKAVTPAEALERSLLPKLEALEGGVECSPPITNQPRRGVIPPEYDESQLIWTFTASLFVDARPDEIVSVPVHRCKAVWRENASDNGLPLERWSFECNPQSLVAIANGVLFFRGPGRLRVKGEHRTLFRDAGYPHSISLDLRLPLSGGVGEAIEFSMEFEEVRTSGGWPLRWTYRRSVGSA